MCSSLGSLLPSLLPSSSRELQALPLAAVGQRSLLALGGLLGDLAGGPVEQEGGAGDPREVAGGGEVDRAVGLHDDPLGADDAQGDDLGVGIGGGVSVVLGRGDSSRERISVRTAIEGVGGDGLLGLVLGGDGGEGADGVGAHVLGVGQAVFVVVDVGAAVGVLEAIEVLADRGEVEVAVVALEHALAVALVVVVADAVAVGVAHLVQDVLGLLGGLGGGGGAAGGVGLAGTGGVGVGAGVVGVGAGVGRAGASVGRAGAGVGLAVAHGGGRGGHGVRDGVQLVDAVDAERDESDEAESRENLLGGSHDVFLTCPDSDTHLTPDGVTSLEVCLAISAGCIELIERPDGTFTIRVVAIHPMMGMAYRWCPSTPCGASGGVVSGASPIDHGGRECILTNSPDRANHHF